MSFLSNIEIAYHDDDLMLSSRGEDGNGQNFACDISSETRVIKLLDGRVKFGQDEVYVPGTSYVLTYKQLKRTLIGRKRLVVHDVNVLSSLVEYIIKNHGTYSGFLDELNASSGFEIGRWCTEEGGLVEIMAFGEIRKNRAVGEKGKVDEDGLVLLQGVDPIKQLTDGYELNGVSHSIYRLGKIGIPTEVSAAEAEFTFTSDDAVKIADGNGSIGKYKDGILTLENPIIVIRGMEDNIIRQDQIYRGKFFGNIRNARTYAGVGSAVGFVCGTALGGLSIAAIQLLTKLFGIDISDNSSFFVGGVITSAILGSIAGGVIGSIDGREGKIKGYTLYGSAPLKMAFSGVVRDYTKVGGMEDLIRSI